MTFIVETASGSIRRRRLSFNPYSEVKITYAESCPPEKSIGMSRYTDRNLESLNPGLLIAYANMLMTKSPNRVPTTVMRIVMPYEVISCLPYLRTECIPSVDHFCGKKL